MYELGTSFLNTDKADAIFVIDLFNFPARSTFGQRFVVTTKDAYLQMRPWWVSIFSASLLLSRRFDAQGRLSPGICPFRPLPTT